MACAVSRTACSARKGERASVRRPRPFSLVELVVGAPLPAQMLAPEGLQEVVEQLLASRL